MILYVKINLFAFLYITSMNLNLIFFQLFLSIIVFLFSNELQRYNHYLIFQINIEKNILELIITFHLFRWDRKDTTYF